MAMQYFRTTPSCGTRLFLGLLAFISTAACGVSKGAVCEEVESLALADDTASPTGQTGAQVLGLASPQTIAVTWRAAVTNAGGATEFALSVVREGGDARFVQTTQEGDSKSDIGCGSFLVVPVRLQITADDGSLDEAFDGELVYNTSQGAVTEETNASISLGFAFEDLVGWLRPAGPLAGAAGNLSVLFGGGGRGTVAAILEDGPTERFEVAASWGDQG